MVKIPAHRTFLPAVAAAAAALLLVASASQGQQPPAEPEPPAGVTFGDQVSVSWVLVPVVVRSRAGWVEELGAKDFRLSVDGRRVPIETFDSSADAPLSLVFLQDLSGSMANGGKLEASRRALEFFLDHRQRGDEFAVASFAGSWVGVEVPFTSDPRPVREAMAAWHGYGMTALHDAVAWVPEISAEGRNRKRAVVLVTDGIDNASVIDPVTARVMVRKAELPVYVLGMTSEAAPAAPGKRDDDDEVRYAELLDLLARRSGGRFIQIHEPQEIAQRAAGILDELRHQYVLGFEVKGRGARRYREIRVETPHLHHLALTYRQGYLGNAPAPGGTAAGP